MTKLNKLFLSIIFSLAVILSTQTTWAQPDEVTFIFTGGQQSFVVPPGVNSIHIQAWGARGSDATFESQGGITTGVGGFGGFAEGDLAVTPGETLEIFVGGQGTAVDDNDLGGGGFNGGGMANGGGTSQLIPINERGGGGGASDVRQSGATLNDRVLVAAGGGGAGGTDTRSGGAGGGLTGGAGGNQPGFGGTQTAGGAGVFSPNPNCLDGSFGLGGSSSQSGGASGGGGGWYGGGCGVGAGGGSSYIGGVENGITESAVRDGDGLIVLTFTPIARSVPTLSEWGLIAMAGLLGIISFIVIRRRQLTTNS